MRIRITVEIADEPRRDREIPRRECAGPLATFVAQLASEYYPQEKATGGYRALTREDGEKVDRLI